VNTVEEHTIGHKLMPPLSAEAPLRFWDRSKHLSWLTSTAVARRIAQRPELLDAVRRRLDEWRGDPRNGLTVRVWDDLLAQGPEAVARRIAATDEAGELARDTMPPGIALDEAEIETCVAERRRQAAEGLVVYGCEA
jgi:hypothetical protein